MTRRGPSYQQRVSRRFLAIAIANLVLLTSVLWLVRPSLTEELSEEYLQALSRYVADDIRYVLLVQDPVTTENYVSNLRNFPWVVSAGLYTPAGSALHVIGEPAEEDDWPHNPSQSQSITVDDRVHLQTPLPLSTSDGEREIGGILHLGIDSRPLKTMINTVLVWLFVALIISSLVFFAITLTIARTTSTTVTRLSRALEDIGPATRQLAPIALKDNTAEFVTVERGVNALITRIAGHRNELEQRIAERTAALEKALEDNRVAEASRSSLIMNLSHDLRTPLTSTLGFLEHANEELSLPEPDLKVAQHVLDRARLSSLKLADEVHTLLQYSSTINHTPSITLESTDVPKLIEHSIQQAAPLTERAGNSIAFHHVGTPTLRTAPLLLKLVIDNLLSNANQYCHNGHISIDTVINNTLTLTVSDTGVGIPHHQRESVFEPFFRGDTGNMNSSSRGMGIGLSLAKYWIERLDGSITAHSNPNEKTVFHVTLHETDT